MDDSSRAPPDERRADADPRLGPRLGAAELDAVLREGAALFDAGQHWHAHEAWEAAWHRAPAGERDFFRGLIHAAAALVHHARGNAYGFERQRARMEARLAAYLPRHHGIDLASLRAALARLPAAGQRADYPRLGVA